jgi:hypothetical protein
MKGIWRKGSRLPQMSLSHSLADVLPVTGLNYFELFAREDFWKGELNA